MKHDEKLLEQKCSCYARMRGFAVAKLEKNGNKGIPDIIIVQQGGKVLFIEFKTETGVLSDEQRYWKTYLGYSCETVRNYDDFCRILDTYFWNGEL